MRPKNNEPVYRLIHSQEMVAYMWRYTLHTQATQIPCAVVFDEALDMELLARAVNIEIQRNDCMRLRLFRQGGKIREFFLEEYRLDDIPVKEFASREEQDAFFNADAEKKLEVFKGETFRVVLFRTAEGGSGIFLCVSHMIMDAMATFFFFKDLMEVYDALRAGSDLPRPPAKYEDIIKNEQDNPALEEHLAKETGILAEWMARDRKPKMCFIYGPRTLDAQRKFFHKKDFDLPFIGVPFNDKTHFVKLHLSDEESDRVTAFVEANGLSAEWVIQLGLRLYLSKINRRVNDTVFWVLCPRRRTVKEKRCGGTLASPMPWREKLPEDMTFRDALTQLSQTQAFLFRHSDVPFTEMRRLEMETYRISLMQSPISMMFSYLPLKADTFGDREYSYIGYNFGHYVMPLYTITMHDPKTGHYVFSYIHRLWLSTDDDVRAFHAGAVRAILKGIEAPEKTLGEIMEEI
ncbi:MAG: hypothetical protein IJM45_08070 [Clostridia bacterium]|nr:hypothetical protein [Clostridia bacterium]